MRPIEMLLGKTGAYEVIPSTLEDGIEILAEVVCRNSMTKKDSFFLVDMPTGRKIAQWIADGKPGNIQDVFPELTADQREQMISGITPEEWDEMFEGEME